MKKAEACLACIILTLALLTCFSGVFAYPCFGAAILTTILVLIPKKEETEPVVVIFPRRAAAAA